MNAKKVALIILLIAVLGVVGYVLVISNEKKETVISQNTSLSGKRTGNVTTENDVNETIDNTVVDEDKKENESTGEVKVKELSDGTLYYVNEESVKADIVIGDNYYDTQIADINLNFSEYEGKVIEIEGMFLMSNDYTFVGRYSNSNLCPTCPPGYSYFEYQIDEKGAPDFTSEGAWIKVIGTLMEGYDEEYEEKYYYIDVATIEEMKEWGIDTVNN